MRFGRFGLEVRVSSLMGEGFYPSHLAVAGGVSELIEAGGRGSGKSSFLSVELLLQLLRHPGCHALAVRKVGNTLRTSVYAQLQWAIAVMGLEGYFKCTLSPLEMEYLPTGQKILFFGMDDAGKLKSLKVPRGFIGILWFEEMDQLTAEEIRSVEQSVFRGGGYALTLKSFNPPADPRHWANLCFLERREGRFAHHSTYLELPPGWLGQRFLADAEHLRRVNETAYRHEYLGEAVGAGDRVFPNVVLEKISSEGFERVVSGVDWGWWPDPWAFNRVSYDAGQRRLYIFDELTRHRTSNADTAALVRERVRRDELVIADSAENKSIADYRAAGLRCRGARKGPGSLAYGMKWLQSLDAIVIDPLRCPETAREFLGYAYVDGGFPDRENHHIDAVRYAVQGVRGAG